MAFSYPYVIHLGDTDGAGVVYFARLLSLCHVAYEESLLATSVNLRTISVNDQIAFPIVHTSADFLRPLFWGDAVEIQLTPWPLDESDFEITYQVLPLDNGDPWVSRPVLARALTRHVCIDSHRRCRTPLPEALIRWLYHWCDPATKSKPSPEAMLD